MSSLPIFSSYPLEDCQTHHEEIHAALQEFLRSGRYILGPEVEHFEREFARFAETRHAIGVASGTDAIEIMLRALEVGPGDGVVVPSHTAVACASGITRAGARPVFVDIEPDTFTLCPEALDKVLGSPPTGCEIKAVLAVHLYGHPCEMDRLQEVAASHGVTLLEDSAQAHGALYRGHPVGSLCRAGAFSFYPTKNLGALGDGGAVTCNDEALAAEVRSLRQYCWQERFVSISQGVNSRLDELQAALLRIKLRALPAALARRRELAALYSDLLAGCKEVATPICRPHCEHAYHLYVIRAQRRDELLHHLMGKGIPVARHYPAAIHQQPGYAHLAGENPALPVTEDVVGEILSLPLHPYLDESAIRYTCTAISEFFAST